MNALIFRWSNIDDTNWAKLFLLFLSHAMEKHPCCIYLIDCFFGARELKSANSDLYMSSKTQASIAITQPSECHRLSFCFETKDKERWWHCLVSLSWVSLAVIGKSSPAGLRLIISSDDVLGKDQKVKWARWWNENGFCKTYLFSIYLNILRLQNCKNMLIWQIY